MTPPGAPASRQGHRFDLAEVAYLVSPAGRQALAAAEELPLTDPLRDIPRIRRTAGDLAAAVYETATLRRRAAVKFGPGANRWLWTETALQQGSPGPVARYRAARLAAAGVAVHDLTCSVGADLVPLIAAASSGAGALERTVGGVAERVAGGVTAGTVGSDLDPVRVAMAAHNLAAEGLPGRVFRADALTRTSRGLLGYADPARRDGSGRRITTADTVPSVADLDRVHADRPPLLRLPPGIDYWALGRPGEVEIVSLDGVAREALLWPPDLATTARRASVLRSIAGAAGEVGAGGALVPSGDRPIAGQDETAGAPAMSGKSDSPRRVRNHEQQQFSVETVTTDDPDDCTVTGAGAVLVDPDPAVIRAGLVRHWAARHGLTQLDPQLAYLTGPAAPPRVRAFRVLDQAPFTERTVAGWIRDSGIGTLEIKQRGTSVIPDELRRRLRSAMTRDTTAMATLVLARIGREVTAFWCRAEPGCYRRPVSTESALPGSRSDHVD